MCYSRELLLRAINLHQVGYQTKKSKGNIQKMSQYFEILLFYKW